MTKPDAPIPMRRIARDKYTVYDKEGNALGDVIAENDKAALERAEANYRNVHRVEKTDYAQRK